MSNRYKKLKLEVEAVLECGSSLPLVGLYVRFCGFISGMLEELDKRLLCKSGVFEYARLKESAPK